MTSPLPELHELDEVLVDDLGAVEALVTRRRADASPSRASVPRADAVADAGDQREDKAK
jgi:hypothetical protein